MEKNLERYPVGQQVPGNIHVHYSLIRQLFPLHIHNFIEVEYVISGEGAQRVNGELLHLQKGSAWILGVGDDHVVEGSDLLIANLSLYPPQLSDMLGTYLKDLPFPLYGTVKPAQQPLLETCFENLVEIQQHPESTGKRTAEAVSGLILALITENMSTQIPDGRKDGTGRWVREAMAFLSAHYREKIQLSDAAVHIGLSASYLSKIFSSYVGCGFVDYLTAVRVGKAKELLATTEKSVTEICELCGFGSLSSLNRAFVKLCGISPRAYKSRFDPHC